MDIEIIWLILPWILALGFAIAWVIVKFGKLPSTEEEWKQTADKLLEGKVLAESVLKEVRAFFNPEEPMERTSIDTIKDFIPANSYQMSDEAQARVLSYCTSEDEKRRVLQEIYNWENPTVTGEECCIYTLETSKATFLVQYGVPELVTMKVTEYKHLNQKQLSEICELLSPENEPAKYDFKVLSTILEKEKMLIPEYELETSEGKVLVKDGDYTYCSLVN